MKNLSIAVSCFLMFISCQNQAQTSSSKSVSADSKSSKKMEKQNIYQFKVTDLEGQEFDFSNRLP